MEDTLINPDLEINKPGDVVSSHNDDRFSGPENDYELRGAVGVDSDKSTREEAEEIHRLLEMEKGAENDLEVNGSVATNDVALSQSDGLLINQLGTVGTDSNKSPVEEITEMLKLLKVEESSRENLQVNISNVANDVALSRSDDLLTAVSSSSTLADGRSSGSLNNFELRGAVRVDSDISSGEETKQIPMVLEMEESAEKDLDVNGSGATNSVTLSQVNDLLINEVGAAGTEADTSIGEDIEKTSVGNDYEMEETAEKDLDVNGSGATNSITLSQVNDFLINQVGAAGTEADTSIGEDIEETSAGNDYEMEESAEKDLEVNGSGAASSATLSQVSDLLINEVGAAGTESDTSIGEDINEANAGKDFEVNISVAANDVAISHTDAIVINHTGAVGIEFNNTTDAQIKETPEVLAMEESSGNDFEMNISVSNSDVALSQSDELSIAVSSSATIYEDKFSDEGIKQPELLKMEEIAEKHSEINRSCAANNVTLFLSDDLLINQIGADGIDSSISAIEEIKEKPELIEEEESVGNDFEANISVADNYVASSPSSDLLIAVLSPSTLADDQSSGEDIKEPELPNMEENAGNDLEANTLSAANDVALFQSTDLINHNGVVGTDFNRSACEVIKEMPKLPELEEGPVKDPEMNISVADNDVALCQGDDLLIAVSSSSTLFKNQSSGEDTEKMPIVIEMEESAGNDYEVEESAEKNLEVTGSGATNSATLSQVGDLQINQVGAVGTESDTSIDDDVEETSAGNDYEMEVSAEKDLDVNGSGAASSATLSQVNDLLINQVGAVGAESDTPRGDDIKETSPGKEYEVKILVAANDVAISLSDDIVINHIGALGIEFNKTTDAETKEMPKLLAMEESSGNDLEMNISVANNDVALSQSDDLLITVSSSSTISKDQSSDEYIKQPELLEMEESAGKHPEMDRSSAVNNVALFLSDDLQINQIGAEVIDSDKSAIEEIKEKPELIEEEESVGNDLEANISVADNDVASSPSSDLLIAVLSPSTLADDQFSGEDIKEPELLNMEENAGNDLEVNTFSAANDVALFQSTDIINHNGVVGTDFNRSACEVIKEMPKLPGLEEGPVKDPETNISVADNDVALCQGDDLLITVSSSSSTLFKNQSSGEDTVKMPIATEMEESAGNDYEVEESAEKDHEANGSGATNSITLSQVSDLLINQVVAVGTESDTSIGEDVEETSAGNDYEMEESVEKDLDVNGSGTASSATLSQVNDLLINQVGAVRTESDTSIGDAITEKSPRKDFEVNISVAANDVAISRSDDIVINHIGAVGIGFNKTTDAEIKEMPKLLAMEESSGNDLETNISVANNDVALSQSDDLPIAVFSSSTISKDQSSGEDIKEPELLNMEENAGNDHEVNTSSAANDVALSQSTDLLHHNGVVGTDFNISTCEVIKEMPKLPELEEGAVKDPETNISVADNDVTLCPGDDLLNTVSSSSMLSDNQSPGEDTEKMPIVLKTEDNDGRDLEMNQLEAANNDVLSQSHDVLITTSFPSTVSDQQSSGHGNETRPELIGAVEIDADKPESEGALEMPKLHVTPEPEKSGKNVKFNLRKSLAWDSAFFTSDGVLDADELSTMMEGGVKNAKHQLPGIEEEVYRSMDSISTLESDNLSLECLEAELFEDIRASIQKSNRSSSNLNNSSIKVSSGKKDSQAKVTSSSKKVDVDSGKRPAARMKHITSSIPQPKIVSRVNSSSTLTLTKRASLSANHAKKDQDITRQPHVIQKGTQAAKTTTQGSKLIAPRRGVPKPSLSSKASPMGSSTALKTELTRPSSSHSNSSSCSSGTDKSSTTLSRKKIDSKSSKLTTTSVPKTPSRIIMKNKPQPPANSRISSHSVLSSVSSSISPASSISEWSSESSSSTTNNNRRSESRGSIDTGVSYRSLDGDVSGHSALSLHPTGRISNQNGNQPISQSGSLSRPPSVQPTGLRMPSPKIGFFDGGKSGARTPNGGNIRPQSKLPTGMPKTGATHSNPVISNGVKSGKIPPPKTGAAHTNMKPNAQKAAPKPSQEQPKAKTSLVTSDASNNVTDGSRTPFAVKNSETF